MTNTVGVRPRRLKKGDPRLHAAFAGWHDGLAGRPFDYRWADSASRTDGIAYECWRMTAIEARRLGATIPGWNSWRVLPPRVDALRRRLAVIEAARRDEPSAALWAQPHRHRPEHLVVADLRNSLIAAGLTTLAPGALVEVY